MLYMHSLEYIKQKKGGNITRGPDGYVLKDGRQITVDDGCPTAGFHEQRPERKPVQAYIPDPPG